MLDTQWRVDMVEELTNYFLNNKLSMKESEYANLKNSIYKPINMYYAKSDTRNRTNGKVTGDMALDNIFYETESKIIINLLKGQ